MQSLYNLKIYIFGLTVLVHNISLTHLEKEPMKGFKTLLLMFAIVALTGLIWKSALNIWLAAKTRKKEKYCVKIHEAISQV